MTMLIAVSWSRLFPALAEVDRLEAITPPDARSARVSAATS